MANEEIKYFNVKNTSIRLIHLGALMFKPDEVLAVVDDVEGINRSTVKADDYLAITDEDVSVSDVEEKPKPKGKNTAKSNTPTGAGWSAKN